MSGVGQVLLEVQSLGADVRRSMSGVLPMGQLSERGHMDSMKRKQGTLGWGGSGRYLRSSKAGMAATEPYSVGISSDTEVRRWAGLVRGTEQTLLLFN